MSQPPREYHDSIGAAGPGWGVCGIQANPACKILSISTIRASRASRSRGWPAHQTTCRGGWVGRVWPPLDLSLKGYHTPAQAQSGMAHAPVASREGGVDRCGETVRHTGRFRGRCRRQGQAGRAVAQFMQPDRGQADVPDEMVKQNTSTARSAAPNSYPGDAAQRRSSSRRPQ